MADPLPATAPTPTPPAKIPVWSPDGQLGFLPAQEFDQAALLQGYRQATPEDVRTAQLEEQYGGALEGLKAAGEGALGALTFGVGVPALHALGITTPEASAGRAEVHPIAHGAGTAAGIIGPLAVTAGAAAPAEAAGQLGVRGALRGAAELTAPALIARAGRGVAGAVEAAGLPGAVGRVAPSLAMGATEGLLYSGADVTEKALLGDSQLTWESAATELGLGALFGGALAGGTEVGARGIGKLLTKATEGMESVAQRMAKGDPAVVKLMFDAKHEIQGLSEAAPGAQIAESIAQSTPEGAAFILKHRVRIGQLEGEFPGITDILSRASPAERDGILRDWDKLLKTPEARIAIGNAQTEAVNIAYSSIEDGLQIANRQLRPEETRRLLTGAVPTDEGRALFSVSREEAAAEAQRIAGRIGSLANEMRGQPELYPAMYPKKLELIRDGLARNVAEADPASIFTAINSAKQEIDPLAKFGKLTAPEHRDAISAIKTLRGALKESLENVKLWGPAAERQAGFNAAQNAYFTARTKLQKLLMQQAALPTGRVTFEAAPTKVNSWINLMADGRGQGKSQVFGEYLSAARKLAQEMEASGLADARRLRQMVDEISERAADIQRRATVTQTVKMLQGHEILSSGPAIPMAHRLALEAAKRLPGGVGHIVGGITGTIQKVRQPSTMVGVLAALDKLAKKASAKLERGTHAIFRSGVPGAAAGEAAGKAERFSEGGIVAPEKFADVSAHLRHLGGSLDALAEQVSKETGALQQHAPATAAAAHAFAARVVQHLAQRLPDAGPRHLLDLPFEPSASELAEYNQHHEIAARGPVAVLEHLARGTLHENHLLASKTMYPRLHAHAQQLVTEELAEHLAKEEHLPIALRDPLGMFLETPLEYASTPEAILSTQLAYGSPGAAQAQQQAPLARKPREVETHFGERLATGSESTESRMRRV